MSKFPSFGTCTTFAAAMLLASGMAFAQSQQQQQQQAPEYRSQQGQQQHDKGTPDRQLTDDADPLLDDPRVEVGEFEEGMVPDGQHADHLHWSTGTMQQDRFHADDLIGSDVLSRDDEQVGTVVDLVLDREGRILAIVIETGAELGLGGRAVAVPWDTAQPVRTGDRKFHLVVEMDQYTLMNAPEYQR